MAEKMQSSHVVLQERLFLCCASCSQEPKQCLSLTTLSALLISEINYYVTIKIFSPVASAVKQLTRTVIYHPFPFPKRRPYTLMQALTSSEARRTNPYLARYKWQS